MKEANLERFKTVIRPYRDQYGNNGYACVIPFSNKEDCLTFVRQVNLTIQGIDDDVPPDAPLNIVGSDTFEKLLPEVMKILKEMQETDG